MDDVSLETHTVVPDGLGKTKTLLIKALNLEAFKILKRLNYVGDQDLVTTLRQMIIINLPNLECFYLCVKQMGKSAFWPASACYQNCLEVGRKCSTEPTTYLPAMPPLSFDNREIQLL